MSDKKRWYQRWYSKLGIGGFLTTIISENVKEYTKNIPVLKYVVMFFVSIYGFVVKILNFEIKVWALTITVLLLLGIFWIISKIIKPEYPPYYNYRSAVFRKWLWRWQWTNSGDGWELIKLRPYCRNCEVQLVIGRDYYG